ncbi:MAG TPA: STAS domain-containing protein [Pseudonocardiaceae bacterium]|jgi:anti-sigma B factor antagonist|nr:STAS domain-containing protein [Pseudonocardiaceae bacterium]
MSDQLSPETGPVGGAELLTTQVTVRGGAVVVRLVGDLDLATVDTAAAALDEPAARTATALVLDLTDLRFFASAGLSLLIRLYEDAQTRQLDVRLAGDQRAVLRPLQLMGLGDLFPMHPSVADALGALAH